MFELIPPLAITTGMKEMFAADEIHLHLLRKWHSGIFRKCLFRPITPKVPDSFLQENKKVKVHMQEYVANVSEVAVMSDI